MSVYPPLIEEQMRSFYESLSEKDRRRYAAVEAAQRGRGGLTCISEVLGCKRHTITQGLRDLQDPDARSQTRIRRKGGGGKPREETMPDLDAAFLQVLEDHTAGSPTQTELKGTHLTHRELIEGLQAHAIYLSETVVKKPLKKHGFVRRKALKKKRTGDVPRRDEPFTKIARRKEAYADSPHPIISIDTKKRIDQRSVSCRNPLRSRAARNAGS